MLDRRGASQVLIGRNVHRETLMDSHDFTSCCCVFLFYHKHVAHRQTSTRSFLSFTVSSSSSPCTQTQHKASLSEHPPSLVWPPPGAAGVAGARHRPPALRFTRCCLQQAISRIGVAVNQPAGRLAAWP